MPTITFEPMHLEVECADGKRSRGTHRVTERESSFDLATSTDVVSVELANSDVIPAKID